MLFDGRDWQYSAAGGEVRDLFQDILPVWIRRGIVYLRRHLRSCSYHGTCSRCKESVDSGISVTDSAVTCRAQARQEAVLKPLRVSDCCEAYRSESSRSDLTPVRRLFHQEDGWSCDIHILGGKDVIFSKRNQLVYRVQCNIARRGTTLQQAILVGSMRKYVMSVAHNTIPGGHLRIEKIREKIMSNFYWPGRDVDVTRLCHSCNDDWKQQGNISESTFGTHGSGRWP